MTANSSRMTSLVSAFFGAVLFGTIFLAGAIAPVETPQVAARVMA